MQRKKSRRTSESRLRFVFSDEVVSFNLADGLTYGDVALTLEELSGRHNRHPIAIDLTVRLSTIGAGRPPAAMVGRPAVL